MTANIPPVAKIDALERHAREIEEKERFDWTAHAFRRRFGPLVAMVRRPSDDLTSAVLTIAHDGDVILEKSFDASVHYGFLLPGQPPEYRLTTAVDLARKFADEWMASIKPRVAP